MSHPLFPVVILAGGLGTRLRASAGSRPKCLVEVAGEPFLFHQLRQLRDQGVRQVLLCLGHRGEQVVEAVGDGGACGLAVDYAFDGPAPLGTAGSIKGALAKLPQAFFVLYGDSYLACDYLRVQEEFVRSGKRAVMTVFANHAQWDASNVEYDGGRIVRYDKLQRRAAMRHIDYGLGVFDRRAFDEVPSGLACDLASVYQALLCEGQLAAYEVAGRFYEIGSPAGLEETRRHLTELSIPARG